MAAKKRSTKTGNGAQARTASTAVTVQKIMDLVGRHPLIHRDLDGALDAQQTLENSISVLEFMSWVQTCYAPVVQSKACGFGRHLITEAMLDGFKAVQQGLYGGEEVARG